jgi:hypothetical protein
MEITAMTYVDAKFTEVENVGFVDGVVRGSASIAILVAVMLIPTISSYTLFALTQLAIYAGLTAFIGWDPIYAMKKHPASQASAQAPATVAAYPRREAKSAGGGHRQAA